MTLFALFLMSLKLEGDDVGQFNEMLVRVAATSIYGYFRPSVDDAAPINGFEPEVIVQAVMLVRFSQVSLCFVFLRPIANSIDCASSAGMQGF